MNYITSYFMSKTNYQYVNMPNIFNFIYEIIEMEKEEEKRIMIIHKMKLLLGNQFVEEFKHYLLRKLETNNFIFNLI